MANFTIPNLCGASPELNTASLKIESLENEITAKLDAAASEAAAAFNTALTDVKSGLDGLALDLPEVPNVNFQSELTSLINDIDKTTIEGIAAFNNKLAELEKDFGSTLKEKGLELDKLITDATSKLATGGDVCALAPNIEIPAANSGTGVTTEEVEDRVSNAATLTLSKTPKEILEVQGKKTNQSFFTNINYSLNGKIIVPKATGTYLEIKAKYIVTLIKEKPVEVKQAAEPPEKEAVSVVSTNNEAVNKKAEFKLNNLFKKLDNLTLGNVDSTKVNADITKALGAIKSPEFKAKMQADLDYAAAERKKLFADPLNYKQVTVNSPSSSSSGKTRTVKVNTVETQNTVTTEKVTTSGGGVTEVKRTSKATISDKGFTHRQVRKKEYWIRTGFQVSTSTFANTKGKTFKPIAVKKINGRRQQDDLTSFVMKQIPYDVERITARSYNADGTYQQYEWGVFSGPSGKRKLEYQSIRNNILPDWTTADKNIKLEYNNRVTNKLEPAFPKPIDIIKITYTYVEKIDPNYSG
tara:strand:+ start:542 stop:2119 length:1578 start_codon:yes stop_codon:yes gene_type:complete